MNLDPKTDLTFTRTLNAPRSVLWECWTTPEHIKNFFVPKPHGIEKCEIDLRVGALFNTTMDDEGNLMVNEAVSLEVEEGKRLDFTDTYSAGCKRAADPLITSIVLLPECV